MDIMRIAKMSLLFIFFITCITTMAQGVVVKGTDYGSPPDCGQWLTHQEGAPQRESYKNWLAGFLSGVAVATQINFMAGTSAASMFFWMDQYCREKPLNRVSQGAMTLIGELKKQNGMK